MLITHRKLRSLHADWAPFAGWSLMLESKGQFDGHQTTKMAFNRVDDALAQLGPDRLVREMLLCLLPRHTYHITFSDLLHQGQFRNINERGKTAVLRANDDTITLPEVLADIDLKAGENHRSTIRLGRPHIEILGGSATALVFDSISCDADTALLDWRDRCQQALTQATGVYATEFRPHLTLGYFCNPALVGQRPAYKDAFVAAINAELDGLELEFDAVGLYSFRSMIDFRRL